MRIHAFRRTEPFTVDLAPRESLTKQLIKFYLLKDTPHIVADVTKDEHIEKLLAVPEAYREYNEDDESIPSIEDTETRRQREAEESRRAAELRAAEQRQQIKDAEEAARKAAQDNGTLIGSNIQPSTISLTGNKQVPLGEAVVTAHRMSALSREEWNELQQDEREAFIVRAIDAMTLEAEQAEDAEREALRLRMEQEAAAQEQAAKDRAAAEEAERQRLEAAKFVLIGEGNTSIDLKAMDDPALREFAKKYEVKLPAGIKGDAIRQVLMDKLAPPAAEEAAAKAENDRLAAEAAAGKKA